MLAVYVSGHGFGHATRTAEVLRALRERAPGLPITVATSAPASLFEGKVRPPLRVRSLACDVGLAQKNALEIDEAATLARWRAFAEGWEPRLAAESRWLRGSGARLVLGDIPPLAFAAAAEAKVRSVALGNFSWDWIYAHLAPRQPGLGEAATAAASAYRCADLLLRLPFAGDLSVFARGEGLPLVSRRPAVEKTEARRRLGLDPERTTVLLSFGGAGLPGLALSAYASLAGCQVLLTGADGDSTMPSGLHLLDHAGLRAAGLDYPDLVGSADVVVSKPGYGIVTDCIGARTRLVYTDRGDFPEYPVMVGEMGRYLPAVHATNDDVLRGRIGSALERVLRQPWPDPAPDASGAERAADRLLEMMAGGRA